MNRAVPFGSPAALAIHNAQPPVCHPTTQDIAIVLCGGGEPLKELAHVNDVVARLGLRSVLFAGNDQISEYPGHIDHGVTLHPDKLKGWLTKRRTNGYPDIPRVWGHRPFERITDYTSDWSGSTGLLCIKIARELGHTHVVCCGVHMTVEGNHFVRRAPWKAAHGFRRGWIGRLRELVPYVRSYGGWTGEMLGAPTDEWLSQEILDPNPYPRPGVGLKA